MGKVNFVAKWHALMHINSKPDLKVQTTTFIVGFWSIFDNCSAANSAFRHWAKHFDKLHYSLSNLRNRLDTSSSIVTDFSFVHNVWHLLTVWLIIGSFPHCAECFVYLPTKINIWHTKITEWKTKCSVLCCFYNTLINYLPDWLILRHDMYILIST